MRQTPVVLVDGSITVRAVLRRMLCARADLRIAAEYGSMQDFWSSPEDAREGVVVVGTEVDDASTIEREAERLESGLGAELVVLSSGIAEGMGWHPSLVTVLSKPRVPEGWETLRSELPELVAALGRRRGGNAFSPDSTSHEGFEFQPPSLIVVGGSTGGPQALREFLLGLGTALATVPVVVVQHIAPGFEAGLAEWLRTDLGIDAGIVRNGDEIRRGRIHIAPTGLHLEIADRLRLSLDGVTPPVRGHRPSVDHLFTSAAAVFDHRTAAVLLSGMGRDGAAGMAAVHRAGGATFAQDEASCSVFGMPASAIAAGSVGMVGPPDQIGQTLAATLTQGRPS